MTREINMSMKALRQIKLVSGSVFWFRVLTESISINFTFRTGGTIRRHWLELFFSYYKQMNRLQSQITCENSARAYAVCSVAQTRPSLDYDNGYSRFMLQCDLQRRIPKIYMLQTRCVLLSRDLISVASRSCELQELQHPVQFNESACSPVAVKFEPLNPKQQLWEKIAHQETQKLEMMPRPWCS